MYELETDSEEEELFDMSRPQEDTNLLKSKKADSPKLSGKAWGRCGKFMCCREDYPTSVFFIVGNEFCERFSFYGMRAVLVIYLTRWLMFDDNTSTALYHGFTMVCYFSPLLGAMIADGWIGKFRTILYVSMIYGLGNALMALTALPPAERVGPLISLLLIGLGTGGIKPCVAAFGGDQFKPHQEKLLNQFFSVFYFAINAGSFLSTILTPIFRAEVQCFGTECPKSCYPLAFGVPAVLMLIAILLFIGGSKTYVKNPASGNVIGRVFLCIGRAIKNRCCRRGQMLDIERTHWLEYADDKFSPDFIDDLKQLLHVIVLFIPLPVFWALFDQQGSRWTLQATKMDGSLGPLGRLQPDQIQALNPVLILVFIPVFENIIYPLLDKCKVPNRPLQRMCAGMVLAASAFVIAGLLQLKLESVASRTPPTGYADVRIINAASCPIKVSGTFQNVTLNATKNTELERVALKTYEIKAETLDCYFQSNIMFSLKLPEEREYLVVIATDQQKLIPIEYNYTTEYEAKIAYINIAYAAPLPPGGITGKLKQYEGCRDYDYNVSSFSVSQELAVKEDKYDVTVPSHNETFASLGAVDIGKGAMYTTVIQYAGESKELIAVNYQDTPASSLSMLAQIPQYVLITAGEVMFSITGLSFSYSQAPASMKSVVQAFWLMTVAFGNLIVVIVAEARLIHNQAVEFFMFAGLMGAVTLIFAIMGVRYTYVAPPSAMSSPTESDRADLVENAEPPATELKDQAS